MLCVGDPTLWFAFEAVNTYLSYSPILYETIYNAHLKE